jgi:valyl-tRNA synthetase
MGTLLELSKTFDSKAAEERWCQRWIDLGYFTSDPKKEGEVFSIVIPPYNVTGALHLGSALNVTLQDIVVRMRRMQGYNTLWVPGTDHAGIATQNTVEREIAAKEKKSRHDLGRAGFEKRVWKWKEEYGGKILYQLRRLGASCDWTREHFTLDPGLSHAVAVVFVELYKQGLIYRDRRLINWCPRCETALSDLEVENSEREGSFYYIKYPLAEGSGHLTVATTRPETVLGDTAVAVNPADERYRADVGKTVALPLTGREIPIIVDEAVERKFGTGAVKITPAHDFNDFETGRRHQLPEISVMDNRARMNENAGAYQGMTREAARKAIVADLEAKGLIEKIEPHRHAIGTCSRCDTVVEPMISTQWFMKMKPLAKVAIEAVSDGRTSFHPKTWEKTYFNWLENIRDWCISRQLWWGHRIPAYRCERCAHLTVAVERPQRCEKCGGSDLRQDEDVLDTWFSSALWPFSVLGWPEETEDLKHYYRKNKDKNYQGTTLLVTAFDIIFFWVARMMMMGLHFTNEVPFRDVYITPLIRDKQRKKMTKSRGNVVDPLAVMEAYGTDALRFTLAQLTVQGRDLILADDRLAASRAFVNKIWNAARFVLMNLEGTPKPILPVDESSMSLADRWILDHLDHAIREVSGAIDRYEFNNAALVAYQFIWHEFCDWYIELAKTPLKESGRTGDAARYVLLTCFDKLLRLIHPFMPFMSEELWESIRPYLPPEGLAPHLVVARWPPTQRARLTDAERQAMTHCVEVVEAVNRARAFLGVHPGQRVKVRMRSIALCRPAGFDLENLEKLQSELAAEVNTWKAYAQALARIQALEVLDEEPQAGALEIPVIGDSLPWCQVWLIAPVEIDLEKTRAMVGKKLEEVSKHHEQHLMRLANEDFVAKAAPEMQEQVRERAEELGSQRKLLEAQLELLASAS